MRFFVLQPLTITNSSLPDHTDELGNVYPVWSNNSTYAIGSIVSHNGSLFQSNRNIYPLATYTWNDLANTSTPIVTRLSDGTNVTVTTVPCIKDVTVVYVKDTWKENRENIIGKYFLYTGTTGDVDFTSVSTISLSNFTEIQNYRYENLEPIGSDLNWYELGSTNRNKCVDKSYTSQSVYTGSECWWEFDLKNINKVVLFNLQAISCKLELFTLDDLVTPFYTETKASLLDTSSIFNWRTLSEYESVYTKNADFTLPFYVGTIRCRVTLFSSEESAEFKLGEIAVGKEQDYAITMDGVPMQVKTSGKITEKENGDVILEDEGDLTKVFLLYNFTLKFKSNTLDAIVDKCTSIINRRVIVTAEDSEVTNRALVIYGFIREASPSYKSSSSNSDITLQIQRFK